MSDVDFVSVARSCSADSTGVLHGNPQLFRSQTHPHSVYVSIYYRLDDMKKKSIKCGGKLPNLSFSLWRQFVPHKIRHKLEFISRC